MGRGRAKAKQTKVARELKYHSPNTDLAALQRELGGSGKSDHDFDDDFGNSQVDDEDEDDNAVDDASNNWSSRSR
ncbi:DUF3073 domain-containing protein [Asanoa sp. NPDC049518]|uniref:DUF3073 domain-containing protein n=1 Tax=unclassified Asanoa TaxID=2685164 RepID=UPI00341643E7